DHHSRVGELRCDSRQARGNKLVRKSVEAVAADPGIGKRAGDCKDLRDAGLRAMECRVEAGDLREMRHGVRDHPNGREVVRLMQWRERDQSPERMNDVGRDLYRRGELGSAMHDSMTDGGYTLLPEQFLARVQNLQRRSRVIQFGCRPAALGDGPPRRVRDLQPRRDTDGLDLSAKTEQKIVVWVVDGELDT